MESKIIGEEVVILLNHAEACSLIDGQVVMDRGNPFDLSAKVEIHPISDIDPGYEPIEDFSSDEFKQKRDNAEPIVSYYNNQDIIIYVQPEIVRDARIGQVYIARTAIRTTFSLDDMQHFPSKGICLRFDGRMPE